MKPASLRLVTMSKHCLCRCYAVAYFGMRLLPQQYNGLSRGDPAGDPRVLLFDAFHDVFRGVVCLVEVVDGALRAGDRVTAASSGETYDVAEVRAGQGVRTGHAGLAVVRGL